MIEVTADIGQVGKKTKQALADGYKEIVHMGGTGAGKTFDLMLIIFWLCFELHKKVITVVSESRPHLDIGVVRIAKSFLMNPLGEHVTYNESRSFFTFPNNNILEFFSADRIDKALGARRYLLFGNEINSLKYDVWSELARRSQYVFADFNPTSQFWLEDKYIPFCDNPVVFKSNYRDNPFLPDHEVRKIEKRAAIDPNFKRIHIDCEYGIYEGLIFPQWQQMDEMPEGNAVYGLDFGYTNDPTALVKVIQTNDSIYVDELIYRTELLNREIIALMKERGILMRFDEIFADAAEPKSIDEIKIGGFNIKPALKGPDSIVSGIDRIKAKKLYVTKRSVNLIRELRNYAWVVDKDGRQTNKPVDMYNHAIDAIRYAVAQSQEYKMTFEFTQTHRL